MICYSLYIYHCTALRAQSVAVDDETEYSFPSQQEIMQLTLPPAALANVSLDPSILSNAAAGNHAQRTHSYGAQ